MIMYGIEPWGEVRSDYGPALVAAMVHNVNAGKGQRQLKPVELMPKFGDRRVADDVRQLMGTLGARKGAKLKRPVESAQP